MQDREKRGMIASATAGAALLCISMFCALWAARHHLEERAARESLPAWHVESSESSSGGVHAARARSMRSGAILSVQCRERNAKAGRASRASRASRADGAGTGGWMIWLDQRVLGGRLQVDRRPVRRIEASYGRITRIAGGARRTLEEMKAGQRLRIETREEKRLGKYGILKRTHHFPLRGFRQAFEDVEARCAMNRTHRTEKARAEKINRRASW